MTLKSPCRLMFLIYFRNISKLLCIDQISYFFNYFKLALKTVHVHVKVFTNTHKDIVNVTRDNPSSNISGLSKWSVALNCGYKQKKQIIF